MQARAGRLQGRAIPKSIRRACLGSVSFRKTFLVMYLHSPGSGSSEKIKRTHTKHPDFRSPRGVKGGVETAFLSSSFDRDVAMSYASGDATRTGIVIEVQQGMVNRGAELSSLSQYPHEHEILFGPLTGAPQRANPPGVTAGCVRRSRPRGSCGLPLPVSLE